MLHRENGNKGLKTPLPLPTRWDTQTGHRPLPQALPASLLSRTPHPTWRGPLGGRPARCFVLLTIIFILSQLRAHLLEFELSVVSPTSETEQGKQTTPPRPSRATPRAAAGTGVRTRAPGPCAGKQGPQGPAEPPAASFPLGDCCSLCDRSAGSTWACALRPAACALPQLPLHHPGQVWGQVCEPTASWATPLPGRWELTGGHILVGVNLSPGPRVGTKLSRHEV